MAVKYPLVLYGTSVQEIQAGDTLDVNTINAENAENANFATTAGTATNANLLRVDGGAYRSATVDTSGTGTPNSVVARDSLGKINAVEFQGPATTAGTATNANFLRVDGGAYRTATVDTPGTGTSNSIAVRDSTGKLNAVEFLGDASTALFGDLAERYLADKEYEVGTVVVVGGEKEVTACQRGDRAIGAVSEFPAFKMNDGLVGGTYIALKGRVPVKVIGPIKKGDRLIAAENGAAAEVTSVIKHMPIKAGNFPDTFAVALETNLDPNLKLVEAIIL